jgi:ribosomal-protein-alanine acetyltransferase
MKTSSRRIRVRRKGNDDSHRHSMMNDLHLAASRVRRFEARDVPEIQEIARQSPQAAVWSNESYLTTESERQLAWVVESGGDVCGFLIARSVASDEAEILNLAVAAASRRAGNATALLQACLAELSCLQIQRVFLEVRESNAAAIAFYGKHKFERAGHRPGYYQMPPEAAVLLIRKLTD